MRASTGHILTSHAGSLPRPDALIEAWGKDDERGLTQQLTTAVAEVVHRQKALGIDVPGEASTASRCRTASITGSGGATRFYGSAGSTWADSAFMSCRRGGPAPAKWC